MPDPTLDQAFLRRVAEEAAKKYSIPPQFLTALLDQENGGSEWRNRISPKGATGVAQFMPATAREYGIDPNDPIQAIDGAANYLRDSLDAFPDDYLRASASYHSGRGAVKGAKTPDGLPDTDDGLITTRDYAHKVVERMGAMPEVTLSPGLSVPDFSSYPAPIREKLGAAIKTMAAQGVPLDHIARYLSENELSIREGLDTAVLDSLPLAVRAPAAITNFLASMTEPTLVNMLALPASFATGPLTQAGLKALAPSAVIKRLVVRFAEKPGILNEIAATAANRAELAARSDILSIVEQPSLLYKLAGSFGMGLPFGAAEAITASEDDRGDTPAGAFAHTMGFFVGLDLIFRGAGSVGRAISRKIGMRAPMLLENELITRGMKAAPEPPPLRPTVPGPEGMEGFVEDAAGARATPSRPTSTTPPPAAKATPSRSSFKRGKRLYNVTLQRQSPWTRNATGQVVPSAAFIKKHKLTPADLDDISIYLSEQSRRNRFVPDTSETPDFGSRVPESRQIPSAQGTQPFPREPFAAESNQYTYRAADFKRPDGTIQLDSATADLRDRVNRALSVSARVDISIPVINDTIAIQRRISIAKADSRGLVTVEGDVIPYLDFFTPSDDIHLIFRHPPAPGAVRPPITTPPPGSPRFSPQAATRPGEPDIQTSAPGFRGGEPVRPAPPPTTPFRPGTTIPREETTTFIDATGKGAAKVSHSTTPLVPPELRTKVEAALERPLTPDEGMALVRGFAPKVVAALRRGFFDAREGAVLPPPGTPAHRRAVARLARANKPLTKKSVKEELRRSVQAYKKSQRAGGTQTAPELTPEQSEAFRATETLALEGGPPPPPPTSPVDLAAQVLKETVDSLHPTERAAAAAAVDAAEASGVIDPTSPIHQALADAVRASAGRPTPPDPLRAPPEAGFRPTGPQPGASGVAAAAGDHIPAPSASGPFRSEDDIISAIRTQQGVISTARRARVEDEIAALELAVKDSFGVSAESRAAEKELARLRKVLASWTDEPTYITKTPETMSALPPDTRARIESEALSTHIGEIVEVPGGASDRVYFVARQNIGIKGRGRGKPTIEGRNEVAYLWRDPQSGELNFRWHPDHGPFDGKRYHLVGRTLDYPNEVIRAYEAQQVRLYNTRVLDSAKLTDARLTFTDRTIHDLTRRRSGVRLVHGPAVRAPEEVVASQLKGRAADAAEGIGPDAAESIATTAAGRRRHTGPLPGGVSEAPQTPLDILLAEESSTAAETAGATTSRPDIAQSVRLTSLSPEVAAEVEATITPPRLTHVTASAATSRLARAFKAMSAKGSPASLDKAATAYLKATEDLQTHAGRKGLLVELVPQANDTQLLTVLKADTRDVIIPPTDDLARIGNFIDNFDPATYPGPGLPLEGRVGQYPKDGC